MTIISHSCQSEFQDSQYGKGKRVANPTRKSNKSAELGTVRCTVCGGEVLHKLSNSEKNGA